MPGKKKAIIVVKEIKAVSPKKEFYVSRKAKGVEANDEIFELSKMGNSSPQVNFLSFFHI